MQPLHYLHFWLVLGFGLLTLGLMAALLPQPPTISLTLNDKLLHAGSFFLFMVWFGGLVLSPRLPVVAGGLTLYGLAIEMLQTLTPSRQGEAWDLVADMVGVGLGWLLIGGGLGCWCAQIESWLGTEKP